MAFCNCGEEINSGDIFCPECNKKYLRSTKFIIAGIALLTVGSALTILSYLAAKQAGGGSYFILYGAIAVGFINLLKGISDYVHYKKIIKDPSKYEMKPKESNGDINEDALERYFSSKRDKST